MKNNDKYMSNRKYRLCCDCDYLFNGSVSDLNKYIIESDNRSGILDGGQKLITNLGIKWINGKDFNLREFAKTALIDMGIQSKMINEGWILTLYRIHPDPSPNNIVIDENNPKHYPFARKYIWFERVI